jgi:hypothetical protein
MSKKASPPLRIAPLLRVVAQPITDPAEQVAIDKFRNREKRKHGGQKARTNGNGAKATSHSTVKRGR